MFNSSMRLGLLTSLIVLASACTAKESSSANHAPATSPMTSTQTAAQVQALEANLKKAGLSAKVIKIVPTEMPGMYWVSLDGLPPVFTSADGKYIVQGDVMRLDDGKPVDIAAPLVQQTAQDLLTSIPVSDQIVFPATGPKKAVVYAFTDVDCGYCRKLHSEMSQINASGIEVHYLAWPRSAESVPAMNSVWCSSDRKTALTQAKQGLPVTTPGNCPNPVMQQRKIGIQLGVNGTPALYSVKGEALGGYMPAQELAKRLGL